jgi:hypothetical protein
MDKNELLFAKGVSKLNCFNVLLLNLLNNNGSVVSDEEDVQYTDLNNIRDYIPDNFYNKYLKNAEDNEKGFRRNKNMLWVLLGKNESVLSFVKSMIDVVLIPDYMLNNIIKIMKKYENASGLATFKMKARSMDLSVFLEKKEEKVKEHESNKKFKETNKVKVSYIATSTTDKYVVFDMDSKVVAKIKETECFSFVNKTKSYILMTLLAYNRNHVATLKANIDFFEKYAYYVSHIIDESASE